MKYSIGQIVENKLSNGSIIVARVIEILSNGEYRLADIRSKGSFTSLINNNETWAAPEERVSCHDENCIICHKEGLLYFEK